MRKHMIFTSFVNSKQIIIIGVDRYMKLAFIIIIVACYAQSNDTCLATNCTTCVNQTYCSQCMQGSFLESGVCLYCGNMISNCINCSLTSSANALCLNCSIGYYPNNSNCLPCSNPCLACSSPFACISCNPGLYLDQNSQCQLCLIPYCANCSANVSSCSSCLPAYFWNQNYCIPCRYGCEICNISTCLACLPSFTTQNPCMPCFSGCLACTNQTNCQQCPWQTAYDPNYQMCDNCNNHSPQCMACNSNFTCTSCLLGFFIYWQNYTSNCVNCNGNCSYCSNSTGQLLCLFCGIGFFLIQNQCLPCPNGCSSCLNSTSCLYCISGYYSQGNSCFICPSGCLNCNATTCFACSSPQIAYNNSCYNCSQFVQNCNTCYNGGCVSCGMGYFIVNSSYCDPCDDGNCVTCSSVSEGSYCYSCISGFYAAIGYCYSCYPCATCIYPQYCFTCPDNSNMGSSNNCPVCPNCLSCTEDGCQQCIADYVVQPFTGVCIPQLSPLLWWESLILVAIGLIMVQLIGYVVVKLRNRSEGYLLEQTTIQMESIREN